MEPEGAGVHSAALEEFEACGTSTLHLSASGEPVASSAARNESV